jgi:hypothetical protein
VRFSRRAFEQAPVEALFHERDPEDRPIVFKEQPQFLREAISRSLVLAFGSEGFRQFLPLPRLTQREPVTGRRAEPDADDTLL